MSAIATVRGRARAFTLVEVIVALAVGMVLAGICTTALVEIRAMVKRAQLRIALHQRAETLYTRLDALFASLQQSGPLVVDSDPAAAGGPRLRLLALTGTQDHWQGNWPGWNGAVDRDATDLRWQVLEWDGAAGRLLAAASAASRSFTQYDSALRNPARPAIDFVVGNARFVNAPLPRRRLDWPAGTPAANWADATRALDANQLFPDLAASPAYPERPQPSLAGANPDRGDWGELLAARVPICEGVTDLRFAIAAADGRAAVRSFDRSAAAFHQYPGAWLDADLAAARGLAAGTAAQALDGPIGGRPRLVRVRVTLEERLRARDPAVPDSDETRLQQTFHFAFRLPGAAGPATTP